MATRFSDRRYIGLETYRRNGPCCPNNHVVLVDAGVVYVRTSPKTVTVNEVNPLQSTSATGGVRWQRVAQGGLGGWEARLLEGGAAARMLSIFKKKYGVLARILDSMNQQREWPPTAISSIRV